MQNRLFPVNNNRLPITLPSGYTEADFPDIISEFKEQTKIKIENGLVKLKCIPRHKIIDRFGKKFLILILGFGGQTYLIIKELPANYDERDETIKLLKEQLEHLNNRYADMVEHSQYWCRRWHKVRQEFREQKRQIKALLLKTGIEIKPGSELSKFLRSDFIPEGRITSSRP